MHSVSTAVKFHLNFDSWLSCFVSTIYFCPLCNSQWCRIFSVIAIGVKNEPLIICLFPWKWQFHSNKPIVLTDPPSLWVKEWGLPGDTEWAPGLQFHPQHLPRLPPPGHCLTGWMVQSLAMVISWTPEFSLPAEVILIQTVSHWPHPGQGLDALLVPRKGTETVISIETFLMKFLRQTQRGSTNTEHNSS